MTISVIRLSDSIHLRHSVSHNRSVELIESCFLEEGRWELPISLSTPFMFPPQEVHEFCINIRVHLLEVLVGVARAEIRAPTSQNRVDCPNLLCQAVDVVVSDRISQFASNALHRFRRWPAIAELSLGIASHRLKQKVHPKEVKPHCGIHDSRLLRIEAELQACDDSLQIFHP